MNKRRIQNLLLVLIPVVLYSAVFWVGYGCNWKAMYSPSPYHRLEAQAMLGGHFGLSHSIGNMDWDLAWHDGQVNHVWGLGIGIWILPFEAVYQLFGCHDLPDRIPLMVAVVLFAWYTLNTAKLIGKQLRCFQTGGLVAVCFLFFPPLWNLTMGYKLVYEDTVQYATILAMVLLAAMTRCFVRPNYADFFVVCIFGAMAPLVRPTFGTYGCIAPALSAFAICSCPAAVLGQWQKKMFIVGTGALIVISGFGFLLYSNNIRFGSYFEFGHRLTVSGDMIVYATRFDNPYAKVPFADATKELFSWLFLSPYQIDDNWCARNLLPFQASTIRWRNIYQPTFDPSWLIIVVGGTILCSIYYLKKAKRLGKRLLEIDKPFHHLIVALVLWFLIAFAALFFFYLHFPTLSTRYILDFSPALLPMLIALLVLFTRRLPKTSHIIFFAWLTVQFIFLFFHLNVLETRQVPLAYEDRPLLTKPLGRDLADFSGYYSTTNFPGESFINCNGSGWQEDGLCKSVVTLMLDRPEFIELTLAKHLEGTNCPMAEGVYRAKIDNQELPVESIREDVMDTNSIIRVRFSVPQNIVLRHSDQLLCLCFTRSMEESDLMALRRLYMVRWR